MLVTSYSCKIKTHQHHHNTEESATNGRGRHAKQTPLALPVRERSIHLRRGAKTRCIRAERACNLPSMLAVAGMQQGASVWVCSGGDAEDFRGCGVDCRMVAFYTLCRWVTSAEILSRRQSSLAERREFKLDVDSAKGCAITFLFHNSLMLGRYIVILLYLFFFVCLFFLAASVLLMSSIFSFVIGKFLPNSNIIATLTIFFIFWNGYIFRTFLRSLILYPTLKIYIFLSCP